MLKQSENSYPITINGLRALIKTLRSEKGCPWDRKQTPETAKAYLLEEAYEVLDALDNNDEKEIIEEIGDLQFQLLFLVNLFEEKKAFLLEDSIQAVIEKMIRRHPHVFGEESVRDSEEVLKNWRKIKSEERKEQGGKSLLDSIPRNQPALLKAQRVGDRVSKVGFDWDDAVSAAEKVEEEWKEFKSILSNPETKRSRLAEEWGDIVFSLVNVARLLDINSETALHSTINTFIRRFESVSNDIEERGKTLDEASLLEMDRAWDRSKIRHRQFREKFIPRLNRLQDELGHDFQQIELLETALCHSSFAHDHPETGISHNERFEFLGDALLELFISRMLFARFPEAREGELTKWRAYLVNETRLAEVARTLDLESALLIGTGEENSGGREKNSILADALEALIASVYLDSEIETAWEIVHVLFEPLVERATRVGIEEDFRTRFQELIQAKYKITPDYELIEESGPDHSKRFKISLLVKGREIARGSGKSKKEAAQNAARKAFEVFENNDNPL